MRVVPCRAVPGHGLTFWPSTAEARHKLYYAELRADLPARHDPGYVGFRADLPARRGPGPTWAIPCWACGPQKLGPARPGARPGRPGTDVIVTVSGHDPTHVGRSACFTSLLLSGTPRVLPIGLAWTREACPPNGQDFPYLQEAEKHTPIV